MKHKPILISGRDLFDKLEIDDPATADRLGLETKTVEGDDGPYLEIAMPDGFWVASWPEHVTTARFDSDASYGFAGDTISEARKSSPDAEEFGHY